MKKIARDTRLLFTTLTAASADRDLDRSSRSDVRLLFTTLTAASADLQLDPIHHILLGGGCCSPR